jgi:UPF0176 protein
MRGVAPPEVSRLWRATYNRPVSVLNIAAYRFVALDEPARWIDALFVRADEAGLKGTIILADEGINLFLAGSDDAVEGFLRWLADDPRFVDRDGRSAFAALVVKRSHSARIPFQRLRVRHRPEIVTMRRDDIHPGDRRAPTVAPEDLARWLAAGEDEAHRQLILLDTRNAFEVEMGTFEGAEHLGLERFEAFPDAVLAKRDDWSDRTVVTFCTGGIRCEKAALFMQGAGFPNVVQLDGGILGYLERVGGAHWNGRCFVFDERVSLDAALDEKLAPDQE